MKFKSICLVSLFLFIALKSDAAPTGEDLTFNAANCTVVTDQTTCCQKAGVCQWQHCPDSDPAASMTDACVKVENLTVSCTGVCPAVPAPTTSNASGLSVTVNNTVPLPTATGSGVVSDVTTNATGGESDNTTATAEVSTGETAADNPTGTPTTMEPPASTAPTTQAETGTPQLLTTEYATTANPDAQDGTCSGGGFDGASFVGGMVLCAGVAAIGSFIYKYYQSRQEGNYHSLD